MTTRQFTLAVTFFWFDLVVILSFWWLDELLYLSLRTWLIHWLSYWIHSIHEAILIIPLEVLVGIVVYAYVSLLSFQFLSLYLLVVDCLWFTSYCWVAALLMTGLPFNT